MGEPLGLIAGAGHLPGEVARTARERGRDPVVVALRGAADPPLVADCGDDPLWLPLGRFETLLTHFRERGVTEAVMVGKVEKRAMFGDPAQLELDDAALRLLSELPDRRDDSILNAIADTLAASGVLLANQIDWAPRWVPGVGPLGNREPSREQHSELRFVWPIAKTVAGQDVGQSVVSKDRAVLAIEAIEGTDAAIRRAGELGGAGSVVAKVAKPSQDPRFDVPAFGPQTIATMERAGSTLLAFEAGATLVVLPEQTIAAADAAGIALLGVPAEGPQ